LLRTLAAQQLLRDPRTVESAGGPIVRADGRERVNFSSNDYLGLSAHPALARAAADAARAGGWGAGASRLLGGTSPWHERLEHRMAAFRGRPAALYFSSGYLANLGLLAGLGTEAVTYFSDERNHASVIDGLRLSRAARHVYRHADVDELRRLLRAHGAGTHRVIVTDAVFSMDGDVAPLEALARESDADLVVDDAHGTGVLGPQGRGTPRGAGIEPAAEVVTLSKAAGASGGFVVADADTIRLLKTRARPFVYSTAPPPAVCAAATASIDLMEQAEDRRAVLRRNIAHLRERLGAPGVTPIVPIVLGSVERALRASGRLWEEGFFVPAIRPPSVPEGSCRLRISLTALHRPEHIDGLLDALAKV
jgi:8-amino-7-oxononanoate synthase